MENKMIFEWDEGHRQQKIAERGLDIAALGPEVFEDPKIKIEPDMRFDYGEDRFWAYGMVNDLRICVCFTLRGDKIHLITIFKIHKKRWSRHYGKNN